MLDLVVVGAGLAGLMAAQAAADAGLTVRVVAKGMGATHWSAGTVDVLGYRPGERQPVTAPLDAITQLAEQHPYKLVEKETITHALNRFGQISQDAGLPYSPRQDGYNWLLPSPVGAPRPVYMAPAAQLAGDMTTDQPMLIVGFDSMRDFYPKLMAQNLSRLGLSVRTATLPISLLTDRKDYNNVWLAKAIDKPAIAQELGKALKSLAQPGERIGLPGILGYANHTQAMQTLAEITGAPIFEIPTLPPSVPGIRLHQALRQLLSKQGVRIEVGMEVTGFQTENGGIGWVESETSAPRPMKHRAKRFLLATGGILGGGIDSDHKGKIWETIFDLPLTIPQDRAKWFRPQFLDPDGQPVFSGGVQVNQQFQPVNNGNGDGNGPVFDNLWASGGILAHADPIHERSLEGIAIVTGLAAGQQVSR